MTGALVVDARGKYLIPGLWDMHVHAEANSMDSDAVQDSIHWWLYPLFVANGITKHFNKC